MGGTLTKSCSCSGEGQYAPLGGWNAETVVGVVRRAHCWVLRQPAVGRGFLGGTGHRVVVIPAGLLVVVSAGCLVGSSVA
jgi:hypothetical protein